MIMHVKVNNLLWQVGPSQQPSRQTATGSVPSVMPQVALRPLGGVTGDAGHSGQ